MNLSEKCFRSTASIFGRVPYVMAWRVVQMLARFSGLSGQVWARNSFVLGPFNPGFSDIDLTLCSENPAIQLKENFFFNSYKYFRKCWPFLGEINYIRREQLSFILENHNYFELMRDPKLLGCSLKQRAPDRFSAAIFLLRQLESDLQNLNHSPLKREAKWKRHFSVIDQVFSELDFLKYVSYKPESATGSIVGAILFLSEILNPIFVDALHEKLMFQVELLSQKFDSDQLCKLSDWSSWFFIWNCHRSDFSKRHCGKLTNAQIQIFIRQVQWEYCGVLTQSGSLRNLRNINEHLEMLHNNVSMVLATHNLSELKDLKDQVKTAINFIKT